MKKFFSLVLALVMALSLTTVAWGAGGTGTESDPYLVADATELTTAVGNGGYIKLTADFNIANKVSVVDDTVIDGAGFTLTYTGSDRAIDVASGVDADLTINNLAIVAESAQRGINYNTTGKLTLYKVTVSGDANSPTYAVNLPSSSDGAIVDINECSLSGNIALNIWGEDMTITVTNSALTSVDNTDVENYPAVALNNDGENVAAGTVVTFEGGSITAKDENGDPSLAVQLSTADAVVDTGDATVTGEIAIAVALIAYPNDTFYAFFTMADANEYAEEKGAPAIEVLETAFESGESFEKLDGVQYNLPAGMELADDGTGNVIVAPAGTTAGGVGTKFYVADDAAANDWRLLSSFPGDDLTDFAKGADDNCLPCYLINGDYYVEVKAAAGSYKLVYGAKTVYLSPVDSTDVCYAAEGAKFTTITKEDDECGKLQVAAADLKKNFFVVVDINDEDWYFVETKNGSIQLLVNGKIVDVEEADRHDLTAHVWAGYDVVNYAYTTVKCANCGKVATLYANGTAAGKDPFKVVVNGETLGWITKAANGFGASAPVKPSTDKTVTSADTFDAGIAMYVGMSVMAAAGSAVVIGKKKD